MSIYHAVGTVSNGSHVFFNIEECWRQSDELFYHLSHQSGCRFSVNPNFHTSDCKSNTRNCEPPESVDEIFFVFMSAAVPSRCLKNWCTLIIHCIFSVGMKYFLWGEVFKLGTHLQLVCVRLQNFFTTMLVKQMIPFGLSSGTRETQPIFIIWQNPRNF